jgi:hypothetical protein
VLHLLALQLGLMTALPLPAWAQAAVPARPAASEAQAALERAQRLADSPMRNILKASRLTRRGATTEPVATEASSAPTVLTLDLSLSEPETSADLSALDAGRLAPGPDLSAGLPSLPALPANDPLVAPPEVPQLQFMQEPALTPRMLEQFGRLNPVDAVLTLRQDGTVAAVKFQGAVDLRLQRVVLSALMAWRYAPLRTAQDHPVRLVFPERR